MFIFNGFRIIILKDKVIASQHGVKFEFKTVEEALDALGK